MLCKNKTIAVVVLNLTLSLALNLTLILTQTQNKCLSLITVVDLKVISTCLSINF